MYKFYSKFLYRLEAMFRQKGQESSLLQKHWADAMLGKKKEFWSIPDAGIFDISIKQVQGLQTTLDEIHKRLSILESNE